MSLPGSSSLADLVAQFSTPVSMSAPSAPAPSPAPAPAPMPMAPAAPPSGGSGNFGAQMKQALPMLLAMVARKQGGPLAGAGLLEGYARGQMQRKQAEDEALALELQTIQNEDAKAARKAEHDRKRLMERESWVRTLQEDLAKINDPEQFASFLSSAEKYGAPIHGIQPGELKQRFTFPDARVAEAAKAKAQTRIDALRKANPTNFDDMLRANAIDKASGKPLQELMATAELLVTDQAGAPMLPPEKDDFRIPNSDTGFNLQIDIEAEEERLGRRLKPGERQKVRDRFLAKRAEAQRAARAGSGSAARAPRNPRGANAIPQGVERYIIDMRNRGYLQADAMSEMFGREVWANMQRDHPTMTAERVREAIALLIPEEGAAVPMSAQASAGAEVPADRVITRAELTAAAQRLGIPEDEARGEYEARGFVIR